jgi:hypothetical protein
LHVYAIIRNPIHHPGKFVTWRWKLHFDSSSGAVSYVGAIEAVEDTQEEARRKGVPIFLRQLAEASYEKIAKQLALDIVECWS